MYRIDPGRGRLVCVWGSVSGRRAIAPRGTDGLCEFWCLHLDGAWTRPTSLTGRQACLPANVGQLRWGVAVLGVIREVSGLYKGKQDGQVSVSPALALSRPAWILLHNLTPSKNTKADHSRINSSVLFWWRPQIIKWPFPNTTVCI